jgi:hypothetical protein
MANRAYWGVWARNFTEATMLEQFERVLRSVPYSAEFPGCTGLLVRALDPGESPLVEMDSRANPLSAEEWIATAREYCHADCAFEAQAYWDLWACDAMQGRWVHGPQRIEIICHGEEYDGGVWAEVGQFHAEIGFEHLFTGHAQLLGPDGREPAEPEDAIEANFQAMMSDPDNLREYHFKTQENIQKLMDWLRAIEKALPVERYRLWSEGEENFEARMDEILAVR